MAELAGTKAGQLVVERATSGQGPSGGPVGDELDPVPVRIGEMEAVVAALVGDAGAVEASGRVVQREAAGELERVVVEARLGRPRSSSSE